MAKLSVLVWLFFVPILASSTIRVNAQVDYFDSDSTARRQQQPNQPAQFTSGYGQTQQQQNNPAFGSGVQPFGLGQPQSQQQPGTNYDPFGRQLQQQNGRNSSSSNGSPTIMAAQQNAKGGNILVEVNLRSYANAGFRLPEGRLCTCPAGNERCLHASPQRNGYNCLTSVQVFILSADDELHVDETPYFPLNAAGQLGQNELAAKAFQFHLDSEPSAIGIAVHNLGPQINADGNLYETNTVTTVDTFVQPLGASAGNNAFGGGAASTQQTAQLQGQIVGTQLSLAYSVSCQGARSSSGANKPLMGAGCDLLCNSSSANIGTAICQGQRTGFFSICRWTSGNSQVGDCKNCPWGIKENAYCADERGGVLEPNHAGVVSSFYYTAFIILFILCGLLLLCLVAFCLLNCKNKVKRTPGASVRQPPNNNNDAAAGFNSSTRTHRGEPERAPLTAAAGGFGAFRLGPEDEGNKAPPPPYSIRSNGSSSTDSRTGGALHNPLPLPRSNASTASASSGGAAAVGSERRAFPTVMPPPLSVGGKPQKMLSPPRFQPLPHLGIPTAAGNDSLNSSFAGLPPPSVSADV